MDNSTQIFNQLRRNFKTAMNSLPVVIGNEVVNFSKESFTKQGWLDVTFSPWQKRKGKKDKGRAILVKSGRLKRSPRVIFANPSGVMVGSDVPYAKAHNEGFNGTVAVKMHKRNHYRKTKAGTGKLTKSGKERMQTVKSISGNMEVKAHSRRVRIPKRKFLGSSYFMVQRLKRVAALHLSKSLR